MPKTNKAKPSSDRMNAKKAAVLNHTQKSYTTWIIVVIAIALIGGGAAAYVGMAKPTTTAATEPATAPATAAGATVVKYPLAMFEDGKAYHFEHPHGASTIRYFILKSSDGVIRAAFDACDVCWPAGMGYKQDGDVMICNKCGQKFKSALINEVKGGCNPAPLKRTVEGDQLVIRVTDIQEGQSYFNLS